jgi:hypothetical protein
MEDELVVQAHSILTKERFDANRRLDDLNALIAQIADALAALQRERAEVARRLHNAEESLGVATQLPLDALEPELRGRRLREVAVDVLRRQRPVGQPIHYREWLRLLEEAGVRVGGKDPSATLLTQITNCEDVLSVRPRSGLFQLRPAA